MKPDSTDRFLRLSVLVFLLCEALLFVMCCMLFNAGTVSAFGLLTMSFLGSICLSFLLLWAIYTHWRRQNRLEQDNAWQQIQKVQIKKKQEQLNALQSQINPHFLYNTLDTIRGLALEHGTFDVADIVATLSSMFKYSMDYSNCMVSVGEELEHLNSYLKIQSLRFPGKFAYEKKLDCDYTLIRQVQMPKLVLQPIVENAFSHGLKRVTSGGKIELRVEVSNVDLQIHIRDNGVGMDDAQVQALNRRLANTEPSEAGGTGIALYNINSRIKLYCGESYGLHITATPGLGTEVTVFLPIEQPEGWRSGKEDGN